MSNKGNFTVVAQPLKNGANGLISYATYLQSNKPKSHENTDILNLYPNLPNYREFCNSTIKNVLEVQSNNTKGGRSFNSYGTSFVCALPPTVKKPTEDEWRTITKQIIKDLHTELFKQTEVVIAEDGKVIKKDLNFKGKVPTVNEFAKNLMLNVHNQRNPHLNIIVPTVYGGERLKRVDQKAVLNRIKKTFTAQALLVVGIDYDKYEPVETKLGKRISKSQHEKKQSIKAKEELANERLLLAQETLAAAQLIGQSQQAQAQAETAQIVAQEATAKAKLAEADADRKISLMDEMKNILNNFKSSINDWIKSIKGNDELLEDIALNDVLTTIETAQNHESYDDATESVMFNTIEQAEEETKKLDISKNVSRTRKYKPY